MAAGPNSCFLVWGGGGHGKVVADLVREAGHEVVGFIDSDPQKLGTIVEPGGVRVTYIQKDFSSILHENRLPARVDAIAIAIGDNATRLRCYRKLQAEWVPAVVHPSAVVSSSVRIGSGTVVAAGGVINPDAVIGVAAIVNTGAIIEHDCVLGNGTHVSPGAVLAGGVHIGDRSWIGAGATVIPGVQIGTDVTIGAGSVVIRDIPDGVTAVGVPARTISTTESKL